MTNWDGSPKDARSTIGAIPPDEAIAAATQLQEAIAGGDRTAAAKALEQVGEHPQLDALGMHWAEVIDGGGELALPLSSK